LRAKLRIGPHTDVLLFAGKLVPFKRPLDLIAAASKCRSTGANIEVMIAGEGELRPHLAVAAEVAGVPLHFLGFCNQSEMPAAYAAADCLVVPSDARETWGLVANEALACGRPVIVSDAVGAGPDLVGDASTGRIFPVADVAALANAIGDVLFSRPTPEAIAAKSHAYSLEAAVEGIEAALDVVAKVRSGADLA